MNVQTPSDPRDPQDDPNWWIGRRVREVDSPCRVGIVTHVLPANSARVEVNCENGRRFAAHWLLLRPEPLPATTPQEVCSALQLNWTGIITNVEIAEDMLGWAVRVTVQPEDKRRRPITWSETGETRAQAVAGAIESGCYAWPEIHGMLR